MTRLVTRSLCSLGFLLALAATPSAQAGVSETTLALAGPLAESFGVPAKAVTGLLEDGISLESVTQLLLVSQSASKPLDDVTKLYREVGGDVTRTAEELEVAASAYSSENVTAAIDAAKQKAQADAAKAVTDQADKALGSALGGLTR
jgi:hypothetical protein